MIVIIIIIIIIIVLIMILILVIIIIITIIIIIIIIIVMIIIIIVITIIIIIIKIITIIVIIIMKTHKKNTQTKIYHNITRRENNTTKIMRQRIYIMRNIFFSLVNCIEEGGAAEGKVISGVATGV